MTEVEMGRLVGGVARGAVDGLAAWQRMQASGLHVDPLLTSLTYSYAGLLTAMPDDAKKRADWKRVSEPWAAIVSAALSSLLTQPKPKQE